LFAYRSFGQAWLSRRQRLSTRQLSQIIDLKGLRRFASAMICPFKDMQMNTRTKHKTVTFTAPFSLRGIDEIQPPGDYAIAEDEELADGPPWLAYRRVATFIHLPAVSSTDRLKRQLVGIDHSELEGALREDAEQARRTNRSIQQ
jgi:hypothetical protein